MTEIKLDNKTARLVIDQDRPTLLTLNPEGQEESTTSTTCFRSAEATIYFSTELDLNNCPNTILVFIKPSVKRAGN